jgi:hypothetical protein
MSMIVDTMKPLDDVDRGGHATALLSVRGMVKHFGSNSGLLGRTRTVVRAVDGIDLPAGKTITIEWDGPSSVLSNMVTRTAMPVHSYVVEQATAPYSTNFFAVTEPSPDRKAIISRCCEESTFFRVKLLPPPAIE